VINPNGRGRRAAVHLPLRDSQIEKHSAHKIKSAQIQTDLRAYQTGSYTHGCVGSEI